MALIDLNCDMGEGFGNDAELMNYVTSVNIACGSHAGDATTMRKTVELAIQKGVAIGAHPSLPDREGFGRRAMSLSPQEVFDIVLEQVSALKEICESLGAKLSHVKPHGALYNQAAKDEQMANAIAKAVKRSDANLILFGLSGSELVSEAENLNLRTASEVFADRTYQPDATLTPRTDENALITNTEQSIAQVLQMVMQKTVTAVTGEHIPIKAETICIHGDGEHAVEFARAIRNALGKNNIEVRRFGT
jgi:UPF0271 protein